MAGKCCVTTQLEVAHVPVEISPVEVTCVSGVQTFRKALYRAVFSLLDVLQKASSLVV